MVLGVAPLTGMTMISGVSQLQLLDERPPRPHSAELMKVLDGINHSGQGQVWFAGRGIAPYFVKKKFLIHLFCRLIPHSTEERYLVPFIINVR